MPGPLWGIPPKGCSDSKDLLVFPIYKADIGGHFATALWLPIIKKGVHFDTYSGAELYELTNRVLVPFLAHCSVDRVSELNLLRKDETSGIERQYACTQCATPSLLDFCLRCRAHSAAKLERSLLPCTIHSSFCRQA